MPEMGTGSPLTTYEITCVDYSKGVTIYKDNGVGVVKATNGSMITIDRSTGDTVVITNASCVVTVR
jgi:hypothetical protein